MNMEKFPLHRAARICDLERMKPLLDQEIPIDSRDCHQNTALHYAKTKKVAEFLIHNKCDLDARNSEEETPLMRAIDLNNSECLDLVTLLVESGADVNCCDINNWNALHLACYYFDQFDDFDIVRLLVSKVYNINAITTCGGTKTYGGDSALSLAAFNGHKDIVDLLIQSGAHVSCGRTYSHNLLHCAACEGWTEIVQATINEVDINAKTYGGRTALMYALYKDLPDVEIIILLINNGAYLQHSDYTKIYKNTLCREHILKNINLCAQILINKYNNLYLPTVYQIYCPVRKLPLIASLKIKNDRNIISEIKRSVGLEIQIKTFFNVIEVRPLVLQMLAARSLYNNI